MTMKTKLSILLFFISMPFYGSIAQSYAYRMLLNGIYEDDFPVLKPEEALKLEDAIFLDSRERNEFEVSHLKNAQWIGNSDFDINRVKDVPKNSPVIVYCSIGARSQTIGKQLKEAGYKNVYNLYGGIFHWVNEGFPVYNDGNETSKVHAFNKKWGIWLNKGEKVY